MVMQPDHPMRSRLDAILERTGMTYEEAVNQALMSWVCDEEVAHARRPRELGASDLTPEFRDELERFGPVTVNMRSDLVTIGHSHPFVGELIVTEPQALNGW